MPSNDSLQVQIRIRPLNHKEEAQGCKNHWCLEDNCMYEIVPSSGRRANEFTFDHINGPEASTHEVYDSVAQDIVKETVSGFNATIFVYGQTSSGKTFTMSGTDDEKQHGLIHLAVQDMWDLASESTEWDYTIKVSFLEIYNEKERDLLDPSNTKLSLVQVLPSLRLNLRKLHPLASGWDITCKARRSAFIPSVPTSDPTDNRCIVEFRRRHVCRLDNNYRDFRGRDHSATRQGQGAS